MLDYFFSVHGRRRSYNRLEPVRKGCCYKAYFGLSVNYLQVSGQTD